ncbi:macro domain-containing protein [candidate division KSB1 bacterium]|nr:macro domain-containing protein [candidate division KSB1 bacterium]RQW01212.1 MAG: macro domain-containing protein [candidate division KSB1 bacterium]
MKKNINDSLIEIIRGDITEMATDAIVNAANERLAHGGGVAGAIVRKGGKIIQQESDNWVAQHGRVATGSAAITRGGDLKARYVIHAVGPVMGSGDEDEKLKSATLSALKLAKEYGLSSLAFPAISTGIFGYPVERCARVMLLTVADYLDNETCLERIVFCLFDEHSLQIFTNEIKRL